MELEPLPVQLEELSLLSVYEIADAKMLKEEIPKYWEMPRDELGYPVPCARRRGEVCWCGEFPEMLEDLSQEELCRHWYPDVAARYAHWINFGRGERLAACKTPEEAKRYYSGHPINCCMDCFGEGLSGECYPAPYYTRKPCETCVCRTCGMGHAKIDCPGHFGVAVLHEEFQSLLQQAREAYKNDGEDFDEDSWVRRLVAIQSYGHSSSCLECLGTGWGVNDRCDTCMCGACASEKAECNACESWSEEEHEEMMRLIEKE